MNTASRILKLALLADTSQFGKNMDKAQKQTKTFGGKVTAMGKHAGQAFKTLGIAAAGAAIAIGVDGVKAAIADQKEQATLAKTLKNTTGATKMQVAAVEKYIEKTMFATGVTDTGLRKSLDRLVRSTGNVSKAQKIQAIALDVSAGTGKDLQAVTEAIAKAYDGNYGALKRLGVPLDDSIVKAKDFDGAMGSLAKTFEGQTEVAAGTLEGRLKILATRFDEAKESIGYMLLEGLEPLMDFMESPEGKKFIDDFVVVFAEAMKTIAAALPGIVKEMGKLVANVSQYGLVQGLMADPKIQAAALAYGSAVILGGPQYAGIAAIAAYAAAGQFMASADAGSATYKGKAISGATIAIPGVSETGTDRQQTQTRVYGGLTSNLTSGGPKKWQGVAGVGGNTYITVNALDPAAAARAVLAAQAKAKRMGVSKLTGAAG